MAKICVPVCVRRVEELRSAIDRAAPIGDLIELRLDYLPDPESAIGVLSEMTGDAVRPMIITLRAAEQGGAGSHSYETRRRFWSRAQALPRFLFDLELDLAQDGELRLDRNRVICSHHEFIGIPEDLDQLFERMASTRARLIKIAAYANDAFDAIPILRLLERAKSPGHEVIAIAMGEAGIFTRILGPSRGSFLTYGSLDDESATAPGQLTARQLREVYRIDSIDRDTTITGLIGSPVSHSISPHIHNAAFAKSELNAVFIPLEVQDVEAFMRRMVQPRSREFEWNLRGLSVTAPHKSAVIQHLHWIDPVAKEIGAINTIVIEHGELHGYNTDAIGFIEPLKSRLGSLENLRCAVIGAGGAARAIVWVLRNERASVTVFARDPDRAKSLADQFGVKAGDSWQAAFRRFDIVINATPLGTRGEAEAKTPATAEQLRGVRLAYDLVYNPLETCFMHQARAAGCETIGGLEMLIGQAVEQFKLWMGTEPATDVMRQAAEKVLE